MLKRPILPSYFNPSLQQMVKEVVIGVRLPSMTVPTASLLTRLRIDWMSYAELSLNSTSLFAKS